VLSDGEVAMNLAEAGLEHARLSLENVDRNPEHPLFMLITETSGELEGRRIPWNVPALDAVVDAVGPDGDLSVEVELVSFTSLIEPGALRGVLPDPREKVGIVRLASRGVFQGIVRRLVADVEVRVARAATPVLSKFTLFVRSQGGQELNPIERAPPGADGALSVGGQAAAPLVLYNREELFPAIVDGRFDPLRDVFGAGLPPDEGGLIYLGGEEPWYFNLVHGLGRRRYEELFQLRRARYRIADPPPGVGQEIGFMFGFYTGVLGSPQLGGQGNALPRLGAGPVPGGTAALHLYGDTANVTPTLVLGAGYRAYLRIRLLDGAWFPYRDAAGFAADAALSALFPGGYEEYREVMAQVVLEPYNRAYDYVVTNGEELVGENRVEAAETPFEPPPVLGHADLQRVGPATDGDAYFAYPPVGEASASRGRCQITRVMDGGDREDVFRGALADLDADLLEGILQRRVSRTVADQQALLQLCQSSRGFEPPGVVRVEEGGLALGGFTVNRAGLVLADGDIEVVGGIGRNEGSGALTLVSRNGDIRVLTNEPVFASLVALRGRVSARGQPRLHGGIGAEVLDWSQLIRGEGPKLLVYDHALDPTVEASYYGQFRMVSEPNPRLAVYGY
jgi:hypothetical protein